MSKRLRIGFVGSGFVARFHAQAFASVRNAEITAITSRNLQSAGELARYCRELGVGEPRLYADVRDMVRDPEVDAVWFLAPNYVRVEFIEAIADEVLRGRATLKGLAVEKPLARNLKEARQILQAVEAAGIPHGYLENQLLPPLLCVARSCSGVGARRLRASRIWLAAQRNTAVRTALGSGGATYRVVAC
jgi:predicted dehydrogenase